MLLGALPLRAQVVPSILPEDEFVSLKYENAPLDFLLDRYSELTDRTMIKSQGVNATITLKAKSKLTPTEALMAIESALQMFNIALVPLGEKFLKVVQTPNARTEGMPIQTEIPSEQFAESDTLISQVVALQHIEFSEAQPLLEQIKHPYGKIQPLERINSLLITDSAQNLNRMLQILEYIDKPAPIREEVFVRLIKYAKASEIASRMNELIQDSQAKANEEKERVAAPGSETVPQAQAPPGVIRARAAQAAAVAANDKAALASATELAERGIIQGKVKIVSDDRTGILFIISRPENFGFFDRIIDLLDQEINPEFDYRVLPMEYADAEEMAGILNEFIGAASAENDAGVAADNGDSGAPDARSQALRDFVRDRARAVSQEKAQTEAENFGRLSPDTKILADKRTNSLMLMGRNEDLNKLEELIDELDVMLGQVLIEAVILEVLLDDGLSYGLDWLQRSFIVNSEETVGPRGGLTINQPVAAFGGGQNFSGRDTYLDGGLVGRDTPIGSALTYYMSIYDLNLDAVITLAANSSDARILSTPVIMTADNTEAKITVGEERPVVSTTSTTDSGTIRSSFEYRNIGINLTVTPRINPERLVVMEILQTADDVGGEVQIDGNNVPIITKREFSAQVAVQNRETIVLGGLVRSANRDSRTKVPFLGDIPILGALFRSQSIQEQRTELLVLITPYVMTTPEEAYTESKRLHDATQLRRTGWTRGWSDSKLAQEPKPDRDSKKEEKKRQKLEKIRKASQSGQDQPGVPRLVFSEDLFPEEPENEDLPVEDEPLSELEGMPSGVSEPVEQDLLQEPAPEPLVQEPMLDSPPNSVAMDPVVESLTEQTQEVNPTDSTSSQTNALDPTELVPVGFEDSAPVTSPPPVAPPELPVEALRAFPPSPRVPAPTVDPAPLSEIEPEEMMASPEPFVEPSDEETAPEDVTVDVQEPSVPTPAPAPSAMPRLPVIRSIQNR